MQIPAGDSIERARAEWAAERPDLDTSPMEIIGRLLHAEHLVGALIRGELRHAGLDRGGFDVLATLRRSGPPYELTPTRLYEELVLTSGVVTRRVDALERAGLVERVGGQPDRRSTLVGLTGSGVAVIDAAMGTRMECEQAIITSLTAADRQALAALLKKLLRGIEAERLSRKHQ
jgi:DNA-binding MarR family transcriptional regulator